MKRKTDREMTNFEIANSFFLKGGRSSFWNEWTIGNCFKAICHKESVAYVGYHKKVLVYCYTSFHWMKIVGK